MLQGSAMLRRKLVKIVPHIVDTVLLVSAIALLIQAQQYSFGDHWVTTKIMALIVYIILGTYALKRGKTKKVRVRALIGAYVMFFYIVAVALTHNPLPTL